MNQLSIGPPPSDTLAIAAHSRLIMQLNGLNRPDRLNRPQIASYIVIVIVVVDTDAASKMRRLEGCATSRTRAVCDKLDDVDEIE